MTHEERKIRVAKDGDLKSVLELYRELIPDDLPLDAHLADRIFNDIVNTDSFCILLLEYKGLSVATCAISIIPNLTRGGAPYAVVENVVTKQRFRKRGFGTEIMKAAIDFSETRGCYKIMLLTGSDNESTHSFYSNLGFSGDSKKAYVIKKGVPKPNH